jgi:thymidylate kinase
MAGALIVFEGANEVGKSTLAAFLYTNLKLKGVPCDLLAFPGNENGTLGRHIYELHHGGIRFGVNRMEPTSLQLLHIAAHVDNIETAIVPALSAGRVVILDRFWWSAWVYGTAKGANARSLEQMVQIEHTHWGETRPSIVFLVRRRAPVTPLYDPVEWQQVARLYENLANRESGRYRIEPVDNDTTVDAAYSIVAQHVDAMRL